MARYVTELKCTHCEALGNLLSISMPVFSSVEWVLAEYLVWWWPFFNNKKICLETRNAATVQSRVMWCSDSMSLLLISAVLGVLTVPQELTPFMVTRWESQESYTVISIQSFLQKGPSSSCASFLGVINTCPSQSLLTRLGSCLIGKVHVPNPYPNQSLPRFFHEWMVGSQPPRFQH